MKTSWVGSKVPRKEGKMKVRGEAVYVDDLHFDDMLYGVTVRSQIPRGIIKDIKYTGDIPWDEFTIVTAEDILGENYVALLEKDQPYLAEKNINHPLEPVVLLAHPDKYLVQKARNFVEIETKALPAIYSIEDALEQKEIIWGKDNIIKEFLIDKGNVDNVWDQADFIVTGEYKTGAQEQLYIEPNGMVAKANPKEGVTVWGSLQCPYYVHKALKALFGFEAAKIRVIQTVTGGGFGGKEEYPSMIAGHAALLAYKSRKAVKLIYDRAEDLAATTKRHPSWTKHKTAVSKDGKILAMDIDFVLDGGAYATLSSVVLSRGTIHAAGPYFCENTRVKARAVTTNVPPHGAFRGFGAPQSVFALERHLDKVAATVGLAPEELRRRNFLKQQQTTSTGQVIKENVDMCQLLDQALEESDYHAKKRAFAEHNRNPDNKIKKGMGLASFYHGAGFTGSGEVYLASIAGVEATEEGKIRVLSASTEIGQGTNTIFSQIVADALGIDYDMVEIEIPDTAKVPDSGPTVASRTCMIVGKLLESAALSLRQTLYHSDLLTQDYNREDFSRACREYLQRFGKLISFHKYKPPAGVSWDDKNYRGEAYAAYAWAVYVAEVWVDTTIYEAQVKDFVALQEIGKVVHPILAAGQIEGGVAQGIGYALYENVVWQEGQMINNQMTNYIMPTSLDIPSIRVFFTEEPYINGPSGAKGIGELPLDGSAPAVLSAVEDAIGKPVNEIPLIPEKLMEWVINEKT